MSDYVVRLTGKDDLSSTVRNVKKELSDVGKVGKDAMSKIDDKFQRIITSSAPLKRQLRDLQAIMADMNLKGLSNTDEFTKIAIEAGRIKDALSDASTAVKNFSNDTMGLQASIQALQGIAAAANVAVGAMALFGNENEDAVKAIKKVQGALAMLNGVQQLANVLNKDSILILKAKQIQQAFNAASTIKSNVATAANTAAVAANTAVQRVATATQKAWNVTTAVGKALLGDISGLILVAAAGYTTYSLATAKSKSKQDELNASVDRGKNIQKQYTESMGNTYAQLMTKYILLRNEYQKLTTEHQKVEWIKENKSAFDELSISVNDVTSAENAFVNNTSNVVDAFMRRAKAAAAASALESLLQEQFELENKSNDIAKRRAQNDINLMQSRLEDQDPNVQKQRARSFGYHSKTYELQQNQTALTEEARENNKAREENTAAIKRMTAIAMSNKESSGGGGGTTTKTTKPTKGGNTTTHVDDVKKYAEGSLTDLETQLRDLQQNLKDGLIPSDKVEETKVTIERLREDILKKKIEIGLEVDPILKNNEELKNKLLEQVSSFFSNNRNIETQPQLSTFDKATGQNPFGTDTLNGIESLMNYNDTLIGKLEETRNKLLELQDALVNAGLEGTEQFAAVAKELENVNGTISTVTISQETLANKAVEAAEAQKKQEEFITTLNDISDAAANTGEIFKSLGQISDDETLNAAGIIAEAIANIIGGYAQASAQSAKLGPWAWAAFSLAGLAQVASVIAQIHNLSGYAEGGIIGGGSTHGDTILGRLNAGEMVLNTRQQSNLFKALDNGNFESVYGGDSQRVDFRIKGQDLYGTLKNFSKTAAKSGKITGIQ